MQTATNQLRVTYEDVRSLLKAAGKADDAFAMLRLFVGITGDHVAAMTLNQIAYWSDKTENADGWFYKTAQDWNTEIGVSYYQLKRACKILNSCGLDTKTKHVNRIPTLHFRLIPEVFNAKVSEYLQSEDALNLRNSNLKKLQIEKPLNSRKSNSQIEETSISKLKKLKFPLKEKTENTTEITTENKIALAAAAPLPEKKKDEKKERPRDLVFEALAELCGLEIADLTEKARGKLNAVGKHFREKYKGKDEEKIVAGFRAFGAWWWREDWRGKQGSPPDPYQVQELWKQFRDWYTLPANQNSGVATHGQARARA